MMSSREHMLTMSQTWREECEIWGTACLALEEIVSEVRGKVEELGSGRTYKVRVGKTDYSVELQPDLEDGGYIVECPALPGCLSQGDTVEEALTMIRDAIRGHLAVLRKREKGHKRQVA